MNLSFHRLYTKLHHGLDWRLRKWLGDETVDLPKIQGARLWRPLLGKTRFFGITGSVGKTTTKELLLGMLAHHAKTIGTTESLNVPAEVARLILQTRRSHAYCVTEISAGKPGAMDVPLALIRPQIGIVTVIGDDHISAYGSREAIAAEKGKLIEALPADGVAVLNFDDPLVLGMASRSKARVLTFGTGEGADLRAVQAHSEWPQRLTLTVTFQGETAELHSQLCGMHLLTPMLAALAGGIAAGLSLRSCVAALAEVAPFTGRMQPVTQGGMTYMRDDFKAPLWTVDASLAFLAAARSPRKIAVIGTLSDMGSDIGGKYARVAKKALAAADLVVFVGQWASHALKAAGPADRERLRAFGRVQDAQRFIQSIARVDDLILLKGTNRQDHLQRVSFALNDPHACWRDDCQRDYFCPNCPDRLAPAGAQAAVAVPAGPAAARLPTLAQDAQVVIGLGNPEEKYAHTPHNVGYRVLDELATQLQAQWLPHEGAWIAEAIYAGHPLWLVKLRAPMNHTGPMMASLFAGVGHERFILVYDDLDLPLGEARSRQGGGAAGHRGVSSVFEAFQTDALRRVKIGVGQPGAKQNRIQYVLAPFTPEVEPLVMQSLAVGAKKTLDIARAYKRQPESVAA